MSALPSLPPPAPFSETTSRESALAQLRNDLVRRFPGAVASPIVSHPERQARYAGDAQRLAELRRQSFLWLEVTLGQGGLAWLAAWTLLRLADDPLGRPALWIDTHCTLTAGDLIDLEGRLVVVRPADSHEAHVAADIALRAGSFSLVALEMHRALHPTPLARLARLANARRVGTGTHTASEHAQGGDAHTPLIVWGEPPPFVAPPSGIARTAFTEAVSALLGDPRVTTPVTDLSEPNDHDDPDLTFRRAPHTTDRLRPLDRAADRRPSPPPPRAVPGSDVVDPDPHRADRDDDAPFPYARSRRSRPSTR
jgi:hypothetical protein